MLHGWSGRLQVLSGREIQVVLTCQAGSRVSTNTHMGACPMFGTVAERVQDVCYVAAS
jgi:hypothetical protein